MASQDPESSRAPRAKRPVPDIDEPDAKRRRGSPRASGRAPKDANAPKKPASSYFLFLQKERANINGAFEAQHGEKPNRKQLSAAAAQAWKELPPERKDKFAKKAHKLKMEYQTLLEAYKNTSEFKQFEDARGQFKANQAKQDQIAAKGVDASTGLFQGTLSAEELAATLTDDVLLNEIRRRMAVRSNTAAGQSTTPSADAVAVESPLDSGNPLLHAADAVAVDPPLPGNQEATAFQPTQGYKYWYASKKGKSKLREDMGPVPKEVIRLESIKRWLGFSETKRAKWETAARENGFSN